MTMAVVVTSAALKIAKKRRPMIHSPGGYRKGFFLTCHMQKPLPKGR